MGRSTKHRFVAQIKIVSEILENRFRIPKWRCALPRKLQTLESPGARVPSEYGAWSVRPGEASRVATTRGVSGTSDSRVSQLEGPPVVRTSGQKVLFLGIILKNMGPSEKRQAPQIAISSVFGGVCMAYSWDSGLSLSPDPEGASVDRPHYGNTGFPFVLHVWILTGPISRHFGRL